MLTGLNRLRRVATWAGLRGGLALGSMLGPSRAQRIGPWIGRTIGWTGPLRWRLAHHWRLAGLAVSRSRLDRYFHLLGQWFGQSAAIYQHGYDRSGVEDVITFEGLHHIEAALQRGRGVLWADFHYHCHEMVCAALARRTPFVGLVRESKNPAHRALKRRWYEATGIRTVTRSRGHGVKFAEALDFLWELRENQVLAVAPDVLGAVGNGERVTLLGRSVELPAGVIALAQASGAPVIFAWPEWREDRLIVRLDEPREFARRGDRRAGVQEWANGLDGLLRRQPECWMQWLDKQWSRVWRGLR